METATSIGDSTSVLVVGAGPTGLALAADLARRGVSVTIIDKNAGPSITSKALGVQAGTLEQLQNNFGHAMVDKMIAHGHPTTEAYFHVDEKPPIRVDISTIKSPFNYILILSQAETEKFLNDELGRFGGRVIRNCELVSFQQSEHKVLSVLRQADGKSVSFESDFIVGCDGAHSAVRHQLGLSFEGDAYQGTFILGDVEVEWPWKYDTVRNFISARGVMATFPMKGEQKYRFILVPRGESPSDVRDIGLEEFSKIAGRLCPQPLQIKNATWLTRFSVHHRMTGKFQKGSAFLAGDAAHIHSPVGGQGMNTGIQDALNLSFKFFQVLKAGAAEKILLEYEKERLPVAKGVVRGTDHAFKLALLPEHFLSGVVRKFFLPTVVSNKFIQKKVINAISEVDIARREIAKRARV